MLPPSFSNAETASGSGSQQAPASQFFVERFTPRTAEFSRNVNTAISYASAEWNALSLTARAEYAQGIIDSIKTYKGSDYAFIETNVLVCLINRESDYNSNIKASHRSSTASGLGQVTNTTIGELLSKSWFQPLMPGFNRDLSRDAYREKTAKSIIEQLNLMVSTFRLKANEARSTDLTTILKRYRGSSSATENQNYANAVMNCKNCIDSNGITESCLSMAKK